MEQRKVLEVSKVALLVHTVLLVEHFHCGCSARKYIMSTWKVAGRIMSQNAAMKVHWKGPKPLTRESIESTSFVVPPSSPTTFSLMLSTSFFSKSSSKYDSMDSEYVRVF